MERQEFDVNNSQELTEQVMKGNHKAWEYITNTYFQPLFGYVYGMVRQAETAEELVQDVFVNFWAKRERLEISSSLKAYLYRAARNHTLNYIKRRNFELNYQKSLVHKIDYHSYSAEREYQFSELETKLNESIAALPELRQEIFKLSRFEDMTYKEIAETLDIPVRQVHYQIGLALKELRGKLQHLVDFNLGAWLLLASSLFLI